MKVLLFSTVLFSGLVTGLLYGYSCSVNPAFKSLSGTEYIRTMQSINKAIQNPVFFLSFMGLLLLFPVTAYLLYKAPVVSFYLFVAAMVLYFIGVFGITIFGNVPLNERLATFPTLSSTGPQIEAARQWFESPWTNFHTVRTVAAAVSFGLTILFILKQKF